MHPRGGGDGTNRAGDAAETAATTAVAAPATSAADTLTPAPGTVRPRLHGHHVIHRQAGGHPEPVGQLPVGILRQHQAGHPQDLLSGRPRAAAARRPCRRAGCRSPRSGHDRPRRTASWRACRADRPAPGRDPPAAPGGPPARSPPGRRRAAAARKPCRRAGCGSPRSGHDRPGRCAPCPHRAARRPAPGRDRVGRAGPDSPDGGLPPAAGQQHQPGERRPPR